MKCKSVAFAKDCNFKLGNTEIDKKNLAATKFKKLHYDVTTVQLLCDCLANTV